MGLSTKQVSGDQPLDWGQTFRQSDAAAEMSKSPSMRRQPPPPQSEPLKCPRCSSTNTKFCYYNNYNKSQPRHFCKSCKRHWTKGGTLRNVPIGGGRKNKRPKNSKPSSASGSGAGAGAPAGGDFSSFPLSGGQKNMSNILYQALIGRPSSPPPEKAAAIAAALPPQVIQNEEFQFSSFLLNSCSYNQAFDQFAGNLETVEESSVTTVNMAGSSGGGGGGGGAWDFPNYWNWNDIDVLTSGDVIVSWDDDENAAIKP